ncbi:MAG: hypothetical protein LBB90_05550 [Tannerella sp.]|jgi:hypothetical protein|nr:hypothetical protein [Tannerella sp.]
MEEFREIEQLLERFFEGRTSGEEEQRLYRFFAQKALPEQWLRYKPLFSYFETGLAAEEYRLPDSGVRPHPLSHRKHRMVWAGVAALLAGILAGIPFLKETMQFDPYEGSYIVRNGVHITDLNRIRPELEATVQDVMQQQEEYERLIQTLDDTDSLDPALRLERQIEALYCKMLNRFQDENIRKEAKEILAINCNN